MGIIRDRNELIPVTCAILKDADRDAFFSQIRKNRAGNPEALAQWLAVPVGLINDWINGKLHIPYNTLQNIAYQFSLEMPLVGELRRESLPAAQLPSAKPAELPYQPSPVSRVRPTKEKKPRRALVEQRPKIQKEKQARKKAPAPVSPGAQWPKLSETLAYWAGILYVAVKIDGDALSFSADRRIGQNFAGLWARKTKELFGISCDLSMREDGKVQEAKCEIPELGKSLSRLCPGAGTERTALPRWVWSNAHWKSAYLKGIVDVSARFQRHPAIALDVPSNLKSSVHKLLTSLGLKPQEGPTGVILISGREELERYFHSVGTDNMKLRDQWNSYRRGGKEEANTEPEDREPPPPVPSTTTEPKSNPPKHRRQFVRPRRTVFRGRPGE